MYNSGRDESPLAYQFESEFDHKSLKSFPSGTAAGPSRWFPEHFVHAVECPTPKTAARTLESLNRVVNILAAGQAPSSLSPWLCSANLFATAKTKGGVRPIAVGEVLRRLTAKCLAKAAFVEFTYGHHSHLLFEDVILNSEKGVQQGDPLGPLIFAVTLHSLVESLKSEVPGLTLNCWYLDDGICAGDEDSLLKALELITSNGLHLGLKVKHSKCELWAPVEFSSIPVSIPRAASNGFELLGAPIGDTEFSVKVLDKRISKATKCLEKLPLLDDPQLSLGITRTCLAAPKLTYSLRTQPPSQPVAASLQVFDELLRDALSVIVGSPVPDLAWSQSSLPIKDGGLGVRQARDQHIPAFLGSSCQSAHLVSFLTECDITDTPYCNSRYPAHMVVMDARTQQVLIDQLFSVPKCVRLARMSERSYDLLAKILWAVPKRSEGELQDVVGEEFMRLDEGNVFQKQKVPEAESEWSVTH